MAHKVTCVNCREIFDRDKVPFIQVGSRRYAHEKCPTAGTISPLPQKQKPKDDLTLLKDKIQELFGTSCDWPVIQKEIKKYHDNDKFSYSGMRKALIWFYEVENNSTEKANGHLGIMPYCYQRAYNYYRDLWEQEKANKGLDVRQMVQPAAEVVIDLPQPSVTKYCFEVEQ